jgi:hypothetical protein
MCDPNKEHQRTQFQVDPIHSSDNATDSPNGSWLA